MAPRKHVAALSRPLASDVSVPRRLRVIGPGLIEACAARRMVVGPMIASYVWFDARRWLVNSFLGIDTHKDSVTVAAVDAVGREVTSVTAVNDGRGFRKVEGFARRVGAVRVGIEGSGSYGLGLAHRLLAAGFDVREVPAQLTRRERRSVARGKSDDIDALLIARVTARQDDLPPPPVEGLAHDLKALVDHRDTLLRDATRHRNRAHALLVQIRPGYQTIVPKLDSKPKTRAARRLIADNASVRAGLVRDALDRVDELEAAAVKLEKQIEVLVKASTTSLTTLVGVGAINAARILGEVIDVSRLSGQAAFGALSGTAPVLASSGRTDRWRLNRGGNRQLNRAIHSMALTQSRCDPRARSYLAAKRSAGKNDNEAMRCLKRHLARVVYRQLLSDRSRFP